MKLQDSELFSYLDSSNSYSSFFSEIDKTLESFYKILISVNNKEHDLLLQSDKNALIFKIILFETNLEILKNKLEIWGIKLEDIFINGQTQHFKALNKLKISLRDPKYNF